MYCVTFAVSFGLFFRSQFCSSTFSFNDRGSNQRSHSTPVWFLKMSDFFFYNAKTRKGLFHRFLKLVVNMSCNLQSLVANLLLIAHAYAPPEK